MSKDEDKAPASLDSVMRQLDALKQTQKADSQPATPTGDAARGAIDFASASAVGCVLGYGLDYWQGTGPWGLLIGLFVGVAAGFKMLLTLEAREAKNRAKNETTNIQE